jgi:hypothetical protein
MSCRISVRTRIKGASLAVIGYEHDHNTEYTAQVKRQLIEGIKEAREKLEPARLGVGWGYANATIDRRARNEEGPAFPGLQSRWTRRSPHRTTPPGEGGWQAACLDCQLRNARYRSQRQEYAHTGDAPGTVADYVAEKLGGPMLYIKGAAGADIP